MKKPRYEYNTEPWDQDFYETGSTRPPKSSSGLVALLLICVIMLCGVFSVLGLLNLRASKPAEESQQKSPVSFQNALGSDTAQIAEAPDSVTATVPIQSSPPSVENIPQAGGLSLQTIYDQSIDAVVSIACRLPSGSSAGTGVIISDEGYVVTNSHVVNGAVSIRVSLTDGRSLEAKLVGEDTVTDLAVLRIQAENLVSVPFGDSSVLRVGDTVVAIGDPLGSQLRGTMTDGIVSAINRDITVDGRAMTLIQTNAALNAGNSGGPLLNCYGQVIGINTMKVGDYMSDAGVEGLGFAIPSTTVKAVAEQLISQGYVSGRPSIGISVQSVPGFYQRYYGLPQGIYIREVEAGSPADRIGLQSGDILVRFNGQNVPDTDTLTALLYGYKAGDKVELLIYRGGLEYNLELVLGEIRN